MTSSPRRSDRSPRGYRPADARRRRRRRRPGRAARPRPGRDRRRRDPRRAACAPGRRAAGRLPERRARARPLLGRQLHQPLQLLLGDDVFVGDAADGDGEEQRQVTIARKGRGKECRTRTPPSPLHLRHANPRAVVRARTPADVLHLPCDARATLALHGGCPGPDTAGWPAASVAGRVAVATPQGGVAREQSRSRLSERT